MLGVHVVDFTWFSPNRETSRPRLERAFWVITRQRSLLARSSGTRDLATVLGHHPRQTDPSACTSLQYCSAPAVYLVRCRLFLEASEFAQNSPADVPSTEGWSDHRSSTLQPGCCSLWDLPAFKCGRCKFLGRPFPQRRARRVSSFALGAGNKPIQPAGTAPRSPRLDLVGAPFVFERAWPAPEAPTRFSPERRIDT